MCPPDRGTGVPAGHRAALCARPAAGETALPLLAPQRKPAPGDVPGERPNPNPAQWCSRRTCIEPGFPRLTGLMSPISPLCCLSLPLWCFSSPLWCLSPTFWCLSPSFGSLWCLSPTFWSRSPSLVSLPLSGVSLVSLSPSLCLRAMSECGVAVRRSSL